MSIGHVSVGPNTMKTTTCQSFTPPYTTVSLTYSYVCFGVGKGSIYLMSRFFSSARARIPDAHRQKNGIHDRKYNHGPVEGTVLWFRGRISRRIRRCGRGRRRSTARTRGSTARTARAAARVTPVLDTIFLVGADERDICGSLGRRGQAGSHLGHTRTTLVVVLIAAVIGSRRYGCRTGVGRAHYLELRSVLWTLCCTESRPSSPTAVTFSR